MDIPQLNLSPLNSSLPAMENLNLQLPTLNKYATDVTLLAKEGKLDPLIGRETEIDRVIQILCKKRKNNPCLIGDPGVGKTVIVEGLADNIIGNVVPDKLKENKVFSLEMGRLIAGAANRGDLEKRLTMIVDEVKKSNGSVILFIDELHTIVGSGEALDAANILKPALARGELKCIGATTLEEFRKYIEKDGALKRRFQPVEVAEPSVEQAIRIVKGLSHKYKAHHGVLYEYDAIVAAVSLSKQYIRDRFLPDKAIDLIDEAGAKLVLENSKSNSNNRVVKEDDIRQIVSTWTGIPVEKVTAKESETLLGFENQLHKHVIGQDEAVDALSRAIRRARVGLRDENKPLASFFFTGPTGVGKTELCNALATEYFGAKEAMVRLDMSEFMERHTVSKLFGSPPGYVGFEEGGQLSEAVRRRPNTVILFDEIEKAHKDVYNVLLQILDTGTLTDAHGRKVDFTNTIIIMTSNIGQELMLKSCSYEQLKADIAEELKKIFKPEFLNRIDEFILFKKLEKEQLLKIVEVMLREVTERLKSKKIRLEVTEKFKDKLISKGYNVCYGARPLRRAIARHLEDPLAEKILKGTIKEGSSVLVSVDEFSETAFLIR